MARPIARTVHPKMYERPMRMEQEQLFATARMNGGMVTTIDPADIEDSQVQLAVNANIRYDKTSRREGSERITPDRPDTNKVLLYVPVPRFNGNINILRFTKSSVKLQAASIWSNIAGVLLGGDNDRIRFTAVDDKFFFTNNGINSIQEIDFDASTFGDAAPDTEYKYITSFFDRLVVANYGKSGSENPILVAWSGDQNYNEFDPVVDISAGSNPLIESQSDYADEITGIFGFASQMLIMRKFSLWGATKQPIATNPFFFYTAVPNIGSDSPDSVQKLPNGLIWYDKRTSMVYEYQIGMPAPMPVALGVNKTITEMVGDPSSIFSSYDPLEDEYMLAIPSTASSVVRVWTYNRRVKAWSYSEYINLSTITNTPFKVGTLKIDDLVGTIDQLVSKIDDLSPSVETTTRFYGFTDGYINEVVSTLDQDAGNDYTMTVVSKTFTMPAIDYYVSNLRFDYQAQKEGSITISFSRNNGATWTAYKTLTITTDMLNLRKIVTCIKHVACRQFTWKLEATAGLFDILGFEVYVFPGPQSKR